MGRGNRRARGGGDVRVNRSRELLADRAGLEEHISLLETQGENVNRRQMFDALERSAEGQERLSGAMTGRIDSIFDAIEKSRKELDKRAKASGAEVDLMQAQVTTRAMQTGLGGPVRRTQGRQLPEPLRGVSPARRQG